jgi:tRNA-dihydrouridine synthase 3
MVKAAAAAAKAACLLLHVLNRATRLALDVSLSLLKSKSLPTLVCPAAGVTCRWAGTHKQQQQPQQQLDGAEPAAGSVNAASWLPVGQQESAVLQHNAGAVQQQQQQVILPPIVDLQRPINVLSKELQQQLWKHRYDFSRADAVLEALGCATCNAGVGGGRGRGKRAQRGKGRDGGRGGDAAAAGAASRAVLPSLQQQQLQQPQQAMLPADAHVAAAAAAADSAFTAPPPAKRQHTGGEGATSDMGTAKLDVCTGAGQSAAAASAAATAAAADATTAAGVCEKATPRTAADTATDDLDGLYAADTPIAAAAVAADVVPPAALITSSSSGCDASYLAKLSAEREPTQHVQQQWLGAAGVVAADATVEPRSRPQLDIAGKSYLAPLTTVGNLPFRRLCVGLGCEVGVQEFVSADDRCWCATRCLVLSCSCAVQA